MIDGSPLIIVKKYQTVDEAKKCMESFFNVIATPVDLGEAIKKVK
jgi:DUF917 family protein